MNSYTTIRTTNYLPLIRRLRTEVPDVSQVWFADDASAVGSLSSLLTWWQQLSSYGPAYGYLQMLLNYSNCQARSPHSSTKAFC